MEIPTVTQQMASIMKTQNSLNTMIHYYTQIEGNKVFKKLGSTIVN